MNCITVKEFVRYTLEWRRRAAHGRRCCGCPQPAVQVQGDRRGSVIRDRSRPIEIPQDLGQGPGGVGEQQRRPDLLGDRRARRPDRRRTTRGAGTDASARGRGPSPAVSRVEASTMASADVRRAAWARAGTGVSAPRKRTRAPRSPSIRPKHSNTRSWRSPGGHASSTTGPEAAPPSLRGSGASAPSRRRSRLLAKCSCATESRPSSRSVPDLLEEREHHCGDGDGEGHAAQHGSHDEVRGLVVELLDRRPARRRPSKCSRAQGSRRDLSRHRDGLRATVSGITRTGGSAPAPRTRVDNWTRRLQIKVLPQEAGVR